MVERDGEALAALEPVGGAATWSTLAAALRGAPRPDDEFAARLEDIQRNQLDAPTDVWPS